jgi:hypothetical protein
MLLLLMGPGAHLQRAAVRRRVKKRRATCGCPAPHREHIGQASPLDGTSSASSILQQKRINL